MLQGVGRHDNPERYGCLYVTAERVSAIVERLARFVNARFEPTMLTRDGLPIALATIALPEDVELIDLDDPEVLVREHLRPSAIATGDRARTQRDALALFEAHPDTAGLQWWSTYEASWPNLTLFDRVASRLRLRGVEVLTPATDAVIEAREFLHMT
jgi:hypothetical protein